MNTINKVFLALSILSISHQSVSAQRSNQHNQPYPNSKYSEFGGYVGAGMNWFDVDDCAGDDCGIEGQQIIFGYDASNRFGVEFGLSKSDAGTSSVIGDGLTARSEVEVEAYFAGVNIGDNFGTSWFKFYGKLGYINSKISYSYKSENNYYSEEPIKETSPYLGMGFTVSPYGGQRYIQFKVDAYTAIDSELDVTVYTASLVYKF